MPWDLKFWSLVVFKAIGDLKYKTKTVKLTSQKKHFVSS